MNNSTLENEVMEQSSDEFDKGRRRVKSHIGEREGNE
jgi:hypothetical protein